jgi:hypothetical protein
VTAPSRTISGLGLAAAALLFVALPGPVLACEPYTLSENEDPFALAEGIQWAFAGVVVEEVPNPDIPDSPQAIVIGTDDVIVGSGDLGKLRIEQDAGCDGFWYRKGERVIAAVGSLADVHPPFAGITNYQVAVWVIQDGQVTRLAAPDTRASVGGRTPATEAELRALLTAAPAASAPAGSPVAVAPTATPESPTGAIPGDTAAPLAVLLVAVAAGLGALVVGRWLARRRSVDKDR